MIIKNKSTALKIMGINYLKKIIYKFRVISIISSFKKKLKTNNKINLNSKFKNKRILLPLIESSHYKCIQLLLIAKALKIRGAAVYVLVCDRALSACELRSVQRDSKDTCWKCKFNREKILPIFGLNIISLSKYVSDITDSDALQLIEKVESEFKLIHNCVEDSVIRHYYGNVPTDENKVNVVRQKYLITAIKSWIAAKKIFLEYKINLVLGYMIAYSEFVPYYEYSKNINVPFKIISSTQFDNKAQIFNWPELFYSKNRFNNFIKSIGGRDTLNKSEKKILYNFLNNRKNNNDPVLNELGISKSNEKDLSKFGINIDKSKRNIFLFSNVFWDVGFSEMTTIFSSIPEWVFSSIKSISNLNDTHLYIRCHPAEKLTYTNGQKGINELIKDKFPKLPSNVTIISSENNVSSYKLFSHIDIALVYNGTIGIELLLDGIPLVIAGEAPYSFLNSVSKPNSKEEYDNVLKNKILDVSISKKEVEMFAYFYLLKTSIPWNLTEKSYAADILAPFQFSSVKELTSEGNKYLDHLCNCLVDDNISPENWN